MSSVNPLGIQNRSKPCFPNQTSEGTQFSLLTVACKIGFQASRVQNEVYTVVFQLQQGGFRYHIL
ncbi:hypothetical protein NIES2109_33920 [Nostoc sp. HK-01]|nr:hypothetical protein NIES2109_33920 [Nostoc sp. HK-01]